MTIESRLAEVRARIASTGRDPAEVALIGVTKGFPADAAVALVSAGVVDLGENYAQELVEKAGQVEGAEWHFLGPIQRNKVAQLAPLVSLWHGLDREKAGAAIARRSPGAKVLVQVNLGEGPTRPGVGWDEASVLVDALRRMELDVRGLMGVATAGDRQAAARQFRRLVDLGRDLGLTEFSIGMSDDLEVAVEAGATMVRVGRAILGERHQPPRSNG